MLNFVVLVCFLAVFELALSYSIASSPLIEKKGLGSDILAAMCMVVIGVAFEATGDHISWRCKLPMDAVGIDLSECVNYGNEVASFGEAVKTTMGINAVLFAILLYFLLKLAKFLIGLYFQRRSDGR